MCVREWGNPAVPVLFCLLLPSVPALGVISLWECHSVCPHSVSLDADPATAEPNLCSCAGCFFLRVQSCVFSLGMCRFHLPSSLNLHSCRFLLLHSKEMSRTAISRKWWAWNLLSSPLQVSACKKSNPVLLLSCRIP